MLRDDRGGFPAERVEVLRAGWRWCGHAIMVRRVRTSCRRSYRLRERPGSLAAAGIVCAHSALLRAPRGAVCLQCDRAQAEAVASVPRRAVGQRHRLHRSPAGSVRLCPIRRHEAAENVPARRTKERWERHDRPRLEAPIGVHSVAGPTLASFATNFGLQDLVAKSLAVISDARLSNKTDHSIVAERLLSITGEDTLTVDRKYLPHWTGQLPTRILMLTNELPSFSDASGACDGRTSDDACRQLQRRMGEGGRWTRATRAYPENARPGGSGCCRQQTSRAIAAWGRVGSAWSMQHGAGAVGKRIRILGSHRPRQGRGGIGHGGNQRGRLSRGRAGCNRPN
jgi:hypothetical protein